MTDLLEHRKYNQLDDLVRQRDELIDHINDVIYHRVKIIKMTQKGVKVSVTYIEMLSETKNLFLSVVHLVKAESLLLESMEQNGVKIKIEKDNLRLKD